MRPEPGLMEEGNYGAVGARGGGGPGGQQLSGNWED